MAELKKAALSKLPKDEYGDVLDDVIDEYDEIHKK